MDKQNVFFLPMEAIEPLRNYREVIPVSSKDPDVVELAASVQKHGQLQACLVRQHPGKPGKYQLYIGFRRHMAAQVAGLTTLKCEVKEVSDDDVLELQVTENLQRQDPHPMDEAVAFLALQQKRKWSVQELATRFAKSEDYVLHRLRLNELIPDLQKDFKNNQMLLGHALLLCKLTPDDQKAAKAYASGKNFTNETVASVKEWIEDEVIQDLTKVKFDLKDATLFPQAGACVNCSKRSGAGNLLFKDLAAKDNRCFDRKCFDVKSNKWFTIELKAIIETKPEVHICSGHGNIDKEVNNFLQSMKVKPLKEYDDFRETEYDSRFQIKAKGFVVNGYDKGKTIDIYLKGKATKGKAAAAGTGEEKINPAEVITGIKQRTARAAELDDEKIHQRILTELEKHPTQTSVDSKKGMAEPEAVALAYIVFNSLGMDSMNKAIKLLNIKGAKGYNNSKSSQELYASLRELSTAELTYLVRRVMLTKYAGTSSRSEGGFIIRKMAESYPDIPCKKIYEEQLAIRTKREDRAAERIAALQPKKKAKPAPTKKAKPKPKPITRKKAA